MNDHSLFGSILSQEHQTKQDIRNAARRLFAERGYNAVSMRDIAQAVGKHQGGLYNHFASKQALLVDLMEDNLRRAHEQAIEPLAGLSDPTHRLEAFVRAHLGFNIDNPDDIFIAYMELRSLDAAGSAHIFAMRDRYEKSLRQILRDGQRSGDFTISDPSIHARTLLAMLSGVTVWYRDSGARSPVEITECYVQAALQSVGATFQPSQRERTTACSTHP